MKKTNFLLIKGTMISWCFEILNVCGKSRKQTKSSITDKSSFDHARNANNWRLRNRVRKKRIGRNFRDREQIVCNVWKVCCLATVLFETCKLSYSTWFKNSHRGHSESQEWMKNNWFFTWQVNLSQRKLLSKEKLKAFLDRVADSLQFQEELKEYKENLHY